MTPVASDQPPWLPAAQPLLTAAAMRTADRRTIDGFGLPGFTLMETAGRAAADAIEARYGTVAGRFVTLLCGKGNNGGDGLVVARVLLARGARVHVMVLGEADALTPDTAHNLRLLEQLAQAPGADHLMLTTWSSASPPPPVGDLLVDALLGTGLTRPLRVPIDALVTWLNEHPQPTIALDLPTGLHSDTGAVLGTAVRADLTVCMGAAKAGLFVGAGPDHAGHVVTAEIGIPRFLIDEAAAAGCVYQVSAETARTWLPRRGLEAHKYRVGTALLVCGSPGLAGAPVMAAEAAARVGAGAVVCACPASLQPVLMAKLTEVMTLGLPEFDGHLDVEASTAALAERLGQAHALLLGCGLGRTPQAQALVRHLIQHHDHPVVLDADGLHAVDDAFLRAHARPHWLLTPHLGEFRHLAGEATDLTDRVAVVGTYARRWGCVLLLKGQPSLVGTPSGRVYLGPAPNPALATAGTGDVLAGCCVGLMAQGLPPLEAALAALHLGSAAAARYIKTRHPNSLIATDLLSEISHIL